MDGVPKFNLFEQLQSQSQLRVLEFIEHSQQMQCCVIYSFNMCLLYNFYMPEAGMHFFEFTCELMGHPDVNTHHKFD